MIMEKMLSFYLLIYPMALALVSFLAQLVQWTFMESGKAEFVGSSLFFRACSDRLQSLFTKWL